MSSTDDSHQVHFPFFLSRNVFHCWQSSCYWNIHANLLSSSSSSDHLQLAVAFPLVFFSGTASPHFCHIISYPHSIVQKETGNKFKGKYTWTDNMLVSSGWKTGQSSCTQNSLSSSITVVVQNCVPVDFAHLLFHIVILFPRLLAQQKTQKKKHLHLWITIVKRSGPPSILDSLHAEICQSFKVLSLTTFGDEPRSTFCFVFVFSVNNEWVK